MMNYKIDERDEWSTWLRLLSSATIQQSFPELINHDIYFNFRSLSSLGWKNVS